MAMDHLISQIDAVLRAIDPDPDLVPIIERVYRADKNPVFPIVAYMLCRRASIPIPDWVLTYLDEGFGTFIDACERSRGGVKAKPAQAFARAFHIRLKTWTDLDEILRSGLTASPWVKVGMEVIASLRAQAHSGVIKETAAVSESIADPQGYSSGWKAWAQFKRAFPEAGPALKVLAAAAREERLSKNMTAEAGRAIEEIRRLLNERRIDEAKRVADELGRLVDEGKALKARLAELRQRLEAM